MTDDHGRFRILVDPGKYDLEIAPRDGSADPRWAAEKIIVEDKDVSLDVRLPAADRITGRVIGPDGTPEPDVDVRVYLVSSIGDSRLRGQGKTLKDGDFTMILARP